MASAGGVPSFDDMIQADRQRRRNEQLANRIFGKSRRAVSGAANAAKQNTLAPTLASRISKAKASPSTGATGSRASFLNQPQPLSRPSSAAAQYSRANQLASAVHKNDQVHVIPSPQPRQMPTGPGFSIKGTAGPFVVQASNFAPGTTAADIEAAIQSVTTDGSGNSALLTCRILTNNPTVIAEMVFSERFIADKVVTTFNNEKADGRILHVFLKQGGPSSISLAPKSEVPSAPLALQTTPSSTDLLEAPVSQTEDVEMSTDAPYVGAREVADEDRRNREGRRADSANHSGNIDFSNRGERDRRTENYQDVLPPRRDAGARTEDRHTFQRGGEGRDQVYDSRYGSRRDERGSYASEGRYNGYQRDPRHPYQSGGIPNKGYRGIGGYGRMYSDDMMRGPPRFGRMNGQRDGYR